MPPLTKENHVGDASEDTHVGLEEDSGLLSQDIEEAVERALARFEPLQLKLCPLLTALKDHNESLRQMNEKRLKAARSLNSLMVEMGDTPLAEFACKTKPEPWMKAAGSSSDTTSSEIDVSTRTVEECINTNFEPLVVKGRDLTAVEKSLLATSAAVSEMTDLYINHQLQLMVTYVEQWYKIVTARVQGRTFEYNKLRKNLKHCDKKLRELLRGKKGSKKDIKVQRGEIKLAAAREAHDSYGEGFLIILNEITENAWKDFFPLLTMALKHDFHFYTDQARVFHKLKGHIARMEDIQNEHDVVLGGRLESLKKCRPGNIAEGRDESIVASILSRDRSVASRDKSGLELHV